MTCERCKELEAELDQMVGVCTDLKAERDNYKFMLDRRVGGSAEFQALKAERDALKKQVAALEDIDRENFDGIATLRANNAALRGIAEQALPAWGALLAYRPNIQEAKKYQAAEDAFKATPADDLAEYRDSVLEDEDRSGECR